MMTSSENVSENENVPEILSSVQKGLLLVSENTEEDFLELGRYLQEGYTSVSRLAKQALDAAKITGTDSEESGLGGAEQIVNQALSDLKLRREMVESKSLPVKTVVEYLDSLNSKRNEIETIAKYLRAVALNIFIETARSDLTNQNFSIIAEEIKELSEKIIGIAKSIRYDSEDAKNRFIGMYSNISTGIQTMNVLTGDAEQSVLDSIQNIKQLVSFSFTTVKQAETMSQEISTQVGNIVMGLQFHDDMRQRLEHIVAAIKESEPLCNEINLASEASDEEKLSKAHTILMVQAAQIKNIIEEIDNIYRKNIEAFEKIITEISQLVQILSYDSNYDAGDYDPFTGLASTLSNIKDLDNKGLDLVHQLGDAYRQASETTQALSNQAKQIHEISRDSHIKALNAIIATQNMGLEGRTLLTLAGEMKILSQQAGDFVSGVGDIINSIVSAVNNINIDDDIAEGVKTDSSVEGSFSLDNIVDRVSSICIQMQNDLGMLCEQAEELSAGLSYAKNSLDFFPGIGVELTNQLDILNKVLERLSPWAGALGEDASSEILMNKTYTMEKEREVHEKTLGVSSESPDLTEPEIEEDLLFEHDTPETDTPETETSETETSETEIFETETSETEIFETETSETEIFETETSEIEIFETETFETKTPETETPETETIESSETDQEFDDNIELF